MAFLFKSLAATIVVPLPTNGSRTSSPSWVKRLITLLESAIGNVAGWRFLSRMPLPS